MSHDKATYTPILSAARQEQLTALRADVRRKLAAYRERRDQSATVLFQHLAYLRFDFILDEADELHAAYNALTTAHAEEKRLLIMRADSANWAAAELQAENKTLLNTIAARDQWADQLTEQYAELIKLLATKYNHNLD